MSDGYSAKSEGASEAFVLVPVPPSRVLDVYALLAEDGKEAVSTGSWSRRALEELFSRVRSGVTLALIDLLSGRPDTWVSTSEVVQSMDVSETELRAALSGFTRTIKAHLGRSDWPFAVRSGRSNGAMQTAYCMSSDIASTCRSLRPSAPPRPYGGRKRGATA